MQKTMMGRLTLSLHQSQKKVTRRMSRMIRKVLLRSLKRRRRRKKEERRRNL